MKSGPPCKIYIAKNIKTGEKFKGNAFKLAEIIGCVPGTVRKYGAISDVYRGIWDVKILDQSKCNRMSDDCNSLTEEDLQKWDDFIKSIHRAKKNSKGRFRKPQEII